MSVPNIADEIERKANQAMVKLLDELKADRLSYGEFYYGVRAIWDTASGLISQELMDMLAGLTQLGPGESFDIKLYEIKNPSQLIAIRHHRHNETIDYIVGSKSSGVFTATKKFPIEKYDNPHLASASYLLDLTNELKKIGTEL
jgi:hypothetical protein